MKPLEDRRWFMSSSLALSVAAVVAWIVAVGPDLDQRTWALAPIVLFAILGVWSRANRLLAIAVIRVIPALGKVA